MISKILQNDVPITLRRIAALIESGMITVTTMESESTPHPGTNYDTASTVILAFAERAPESLEDGKKDG